MDKYLDCKDVGLDCAYSACGDTEEEALRKLGEHILSTHGIEGFSKEFYAKARLAVRDGDCSAAETGAEECSECGEEYFACDECCC